MSNYILSADWHTRLSRPQYRIDDYVETLLGKIFFIVDTANRHKADLIIAGDIFHDIKVKTRAINRIIRILKGLKGTCYAIPGQHDLEHHSEDMTSSPYLTLMESDVICNLSSNPVNNVYGVPWEGNLDGLGKVKENAILVIHHCVTPEKSPFFLEDSAMTAQEILDSCPEFRYIVSGDYHVPFIKRENDRILINCGCITRANKDMVDFQPVIHLLDTERGTVSSINIPIRPYEEVFSIPKECKVDSQFSENITSILELIESDEKPDFITTVHLIMKDEQFTDNQRLLADKYYNLVREA